MNRSRGYYIVRRIVRIAFWTIVITGILALVGVAGHGDLQDAKQTEYQLTHLHD